MLAIEAHKKINFERGLEKVGDILNSVFHVFLILSIQYKIAHAKSDKNKIHSFSILMATSPSVQQQLSFLWSLDFGEIQRTQKQLFISF